MLFLALMLAAGPSSLTTGEVPKEAKQQSQRIIELPDAYPRWPFTPLADPPAPTAADPIPHLGFSRRPRQARISEVFGVPVIKPEEGALGPRLNFSFMGAKAPKGTSVAGGISFSMQFK
jgi:hypothetical protein